MIVTTIDERNEYSTEKEDLHQLLVSGDKIMFMYVEIEPQSEMPFHSHVQETVGICLKGEMEYQVEGKTVIVKPNDAYLINSNEKHRSKVVGNEKAVLLEAFSPPREDLLAKFKR